MTSCKLSRRQLQLQLLFCGYVTGALSVGAAYTQHTRKTWQAHIGLGLELHTQPSRACRARPAPHMAASESSLLEQSTQRK